MLMSYARQQAEPDGRFELIHLEPGTYVLGVDPGGMQSRSAQVGALYFGADGRAGGGRPIVVGPGTRSQIPPVTLPADVHLVALEGTVEDAAGRAIPEVSVSMRLKSPPVVLGGFALTNERGQFFYELWSGVDYEIELQRRTDQGVDRHVEPLRLTSDPRPITFRFPSGDGPSS